MRAAKWSLHVSVSDIHINVFGLGKGTVSVICPIFLISCWCTSSFMFYGSAAGVFWQIFKDFFWTIFQVFWCFKNACRQMERACFNLQYLPQRSWTSGEHGISNLAYYFTFRWFASSFNFYGSAAGAICDIFKCFILIIFHVFWCLKMRAAKWSLRASIYNTYINALGFGENIVSVICCIFLHLVGSHLHSIFMGRQ